MKDDALPPLPMKPSEVAELYGLSRSRIYREIKAGRLRARHRRGQTRGWFITREDVEEWVNHGLLED